ncbi:MAG: acyl-CoA dehydrogenase family protein, partial [Deltaproteobacteria bacterium]|nr:acyl-CoA dehydrogenase family protein [Deltaproteobacteria bacterium]
MEFVYSEEEKMMLQMARSFAEKEVKPLAKETDKEHKYPAET